MTRHDVITLQAHRAYPSISVLLPTHRTSPDNKRDPILLKNLLSEANERLEALLGARGAAPLQASLAAQAAAVDLRHTLDGLALFVNETHAGAYLLPVALKPRVVIDETFATRDLIFALNRSPRYWVLALSEKPTRLFEGVRRTLIEVHAGGFPCEHTGPGGAMSLPELIDKSKYEDEQHRQFFRRVDRALDPFLKHDPLPLCVVGVERWLAHYREVAKDRLWTASLTGSHDQTSPTDLGRLVWPVMERALHAERLRALETLDAAAGAQRVASGIVDAWARAHDGRGALLLVEEGYHQAAKLAADGRLQPLTDGEAPPPLGFEETIIDDAVDEIIEAVLMNSGDVVFVDDDSLSEHGRIALTLRY
jgi:hypothetical protein